MTTRCFEDIQGGSGIVKFRMTMNTREGEAVLTYTDLVMVRRRDPSDSPQVEIEN